MLEESEQEFLRTLWTRRVTVTYVLFAVNILIYVLMEFAGGTRSNELNTLLAFGAKSNPEIDQGEIWRFITPIFIHIGLIHLFFNSYALWIIGPQVEKLYGGARFLVLYVLTGVGGVAASYWYNPYKPSAGASGAIFGLFGVLLVFGLKYRNSVPRGFAQALSKGVLITVGINLVIGFSIPFVDNSAHIGGLISGAALAAIIPFERPGSEPVPFFKVLQAIVVFAVAASFFQVAAHYNGPGLSFRNLTHGWGQMFEGSSSDFIVAINANQTAFQNSIEVLSSSDPEKVASGLPMVKADLAKAIDLLNRMPAISRRVDDISAELLALTRKQYELVQDIEHSGGMTFEHSRRAGNNARNYEKLTRDFDEWVRQEGEKHGIARGK